MPDKPWHMQPVIDADSLTEEYASKYELFDSRKLIGTIIGSIAFICCVLFFTYAWYTWSGEHITINGDVVDEYGADTLRLYEMFMGPLQDAKPWNTKNIEGSRKFIERVWRLLVDENRITEEDNSNLVQIYHQTVKKVTEDYEALSFNTAISQMMIFVNEVYKVNKLPKAYAEGFVKMISCITPHLGEELWSLLGHDNTIAYEPWPTYILELTKNDEITVVVQINGKIRDKLLVANNTPKEELEKLALASEKVIANLNGKTPKKVIVVPNKLVSIVI